MRFRWYAEKDRTNQKKHRGLDFETAARVFDDADLILRKDRIVEGEQRWHAIGAVSSAVLLVVHTYRTRDSNGEEEIVRIISARQANRRERQVYFQKAAE
jgi:uncharacterized protein